MNDPLSADRLTNLFRTSSQDPLRIINREGSSIEFKESYSHSGIAQYFKTMASFANNSGGYIIFGVANKPRRLVGLKDRNLTQFEDLKVEEFTRSLTEYFSPEIKWDHCTFEYKELSFGVIFTFPLIEKPCICKKHYDAADPKYTLREGDIFYRYGGKSERIHYEELKSIIETRRHQEEQLWIDLIRKTSKIGVSNACLLDLNSGVVSGSGGTILIDEELLAKISFIKQGEFVEKEGKPTLRLIGDVQQIKNGTFVVKETTKRVVKAIEAGDIITAFLEETEVEDPFEYLRAICSASSANLPVYFLISQSGEAIGNAISVVEEIKTRGVVKKRLLERLHGKMVPQVTFPTSETDAALKKKRICSLWLSEDLDINQNELNYVLSAFLSLSKEDVINHSKYIRAVLYSIYNQFYEKAKPYLASEIRKAICRFDELLYQVGEDNDGEI